LCIRDGSCIILGFSGAQAKASAGRRPIGVILKVRDATAHSEPPPQMTPLRLLGIENIGGQYKRGWAYNIIYIVELLKIIAF